LANFKPKEQLRHRAVFFAAARLSCLLIVPLSLNFWRCWL